LKARKPRRTPLEFMMAPMIDCTFLLLIFFMVASQAKIPPRFPVELPDSLTRTNFPLKRFTLFIGRNGELAVDDQIMMSYEDLEEYLAKNETRIETLIIKADKNALHGWVIDAMERAKRRDIEELALAVKEGGGVGIKVD